TPDQLADLKQRNHPNVNPTLDGVAPFTADTFAISPGERIPLHATWAACSDGEASCTGSEHYASFAPSTQTVVGRTEAMRISWFATDGSFDEDRTGREEGDPAAFTDNTWFAPKRAGLVHLWVVLRDDRGGVGWRGFVIDVK